MDKDKSRIPDTTNVKHFQPNHLYLFPDFYCGMMHYKHRMVGQLDVQMMNVPSNVSTNMSIIQMYGVEHAGSVVIRKPIKDSSSSIMYYIDRDTKLRETHYNYLSVKEDAVRSRYFQHGSKMVGYNTAENCVRINFSEVCIKLFID